MPSRNQRETEAVLTYMSRRLSRPRYQEHRNGLRLWPVGAALAVIFAAAIVVAAGAFLTGWNLLDADGLKPEHRLTSSTLFDLVKLSFGVVAGSGALVALVVAYRRQRVDEEGALREATRLHTERFSQAVDKLGSDSPAVRLGGVHALAGLADDAPNDNLRQTCIDVLCAYLQLPFTPDPGDLPGHQEEHHRYLALRKVRHTILSLIGDHYRRPIGTYGSWQGRDLDLTGVTIDGPMIFNGATFSGGRVLFSGATFSDGGMVHFNRATFSGGLVSFHEAAFSGGRLSFSGSTFSGAVVIFAEAMFSGSTVSFDHATFSDGRLEFERAKFCDGLVTFNDATFSGSRMAFGPELSGDRDSAVSLPVGATFSGGNVVFGGTTFSGGKVVFGCTTFSGSRVDFIHAAFSGGRVDFGGSAFSGGRVNFLGTTFSDGTVDFGGAAFLGGNMDFNQVTGPAPHGLLHAVGAPPSAGVNLPAAWLTPNP
ncbi:pentapeptide repeat-containing protein [Streptomyces eurythermus]